MRATLPASTGCVALSAGSATVPPVPMGPCASQRSSSSSLLSPWALSSGLDTSTTISVGYQPSRVCFSVFGEIVCAGKDVRYLRACVCLSVCLHGIHAPAQFAFVNNM